jgi:hypothetical protein
MSLTQPAQPCPPPPSGDDDVVQLKPVGRKSGAVAATPAAARSARVSDAELQRRVRLNSDADDLVPIVSDDEDGGLGLDARESLRIDPEAGEAKPGRRARVSAKKRAEDHAGASLFLLGMGVCPCCFGSSLMAMAGSALL